ncbi:NAD(P)H-hydrate dehydratase [Luteimonas sp. Y-2-2-4F]|nr:NAD(P)H-hydrate dehydratase [Luteimonas sp. Y-2-2-4F]MCD9030973.1 NAD(P)H-hydrate dehydratase [Luteimonas sp. Y-2-2-4F]
MSAPSARAPDDLYGHAALRALEAAAIAQAGGDGFALMARAGESAWRLAERTWPQARRLLVLCGPGNNGGDGYVFARHALAAGREVRALHPPGHAPRSALAQRAAAAFEAAGGRIEEAATALPPADLVVDALFGIGLDRAPGDGAAALIAAANACGAEVLALDVPSGVDAGRGAVPGAAIRAAHTLQFLAPHAGLYTGAALDHVGQAHVDTLGVALALFERAAPAARRLDAGDLAARLRPRARDSHKGAGGHVLCVGGDHGKGGAVLLAAEAALRSGAGLVSAATRAGHVAALLARRPEAMAQAVEAGEGFAGLLERAGVVALGPGLGTEAWGEALYAQALASGRALVLDADALNLLARRGDALPPETVLTPHPGEAARLLGTDTRAIQRDRYAAAAALAQRYGCVAVLKGAGTVVAAAGELARVISAGNPGMAVGGMGDLLTGCVAALRAQGAAPFEGACTAALLHACAGDDAAGEGGERGLLPADLLPHLRRRANP